MIQTVSCIGITEVSNMKEIETVVKKVGNTTVIIHPGSAQTEAEIEQVEKNLNEALYRAWLNIKSESNYPYCEQKREEVRS